MSVAVRGNSGSGLTTVYTAPLFSDVQIETLKFQVDTNASAGIHRVRIRLVDPALGSIATLDDLNNGGQSQQNFYTYGLGLNASACTMPTGWAVTDALPWTELSAGGTVTIMPMTDAGVEIAGDAISEVRLQVRYAQAAGPTDDTLQTIYFMPGSQAA